jgi:hypothetical protein
MVEVGGLSLRRDQTILEETIKTILDDIEHVE